jgi:DNA-directed RNA polymerase subunit E'/Rpb7
MDNTLKVLLKEKIKLEPKFLCKKYHIEILKKLKEKVEGKCTKHGYIEEDSIEIYKITPGVIDIASLCGMIIYDVYFNAKLCNPVIGNIIKAHVKNTNRFGVLLEAKPVMDIIIAKNSINIQSEIDLETVKIDQELTIEIIGKKFELGDKRITIIGKVIKDVVLPVKKLSSATVLDENSDVEEDENAEIIEDEDEDAEIIEDEDEIIEEEEEPEDEEDAESIVGGVAITSGDFDIFDDEEGGEAENDEFWESDEGGEYDNDD